MPHGLTQIGTHMAAKSSGRIASLDGLRAISILLVILGHLYGTAGLPAPVQSSLAFIRGYVDIANLGVRVFFVISGFLITGLLLKEAEESGTIRLSRFYLRRAMRIFPAYFALLAAVAVSARLGWIQLASGDMIHALTYTMNYSPERSWSLGHLWSLAVEEQFYLLWPAALLLLGVRRAFWVAAAFILAAPIIRLGGWYVYPAGLQAGIGETFETVGDALAVGCVLAGVRDVLWRWQWYRQILTSLWFVPAAILAAAVLRHWFRLDLLVGTSAMNFAIAFAIDRSIRLSDVGFGRFLNLRFVSWIGVLSYSIYLWQQLFFNRTSDAWTAHFPVSVVLAFSAAVLSYYLVERPMMRLRGRVERWLKRPVATAPEPAPQ